MPATTIHTDVSGLQRLIDVPEHVTGVRWAYTRTHGNASLVAVVRLDGPGLERVLRESPRLDVQSPVTIDAALAGDDGQGGQSHGANQWQGVNIEPRAFVNPKKSGLLNGVATVVAESGFVYVALYEL